MVQAEEVCVCGYRRQCGSGRGGVCVGIGDSVWFRQRRFVCVGIGDSVVQAEEVCVWV